MLMRNAATESGAAELFRSLDAPRDTEAALREVEGHLGALEEADGFPSEEMWRRVRAGTLPEDEGVCTWLTLMARRARLRGAFRA